VRHEALSLADNSLMPEFSAHKAMQVSDSMNTFYVLTCLPDNRDIVTPEVKMPAKEKILSQQKPAKSLSAHSCDAINGETL